MTGLQRFIKAQRGKDSYPSYKEAYNEIDAGKKQSHWIWYIFPQLETLGYSSPAKFFGIVDFNEACEYLQNDELFKNYQAITLLVLKRLDTTPIELLMGGTIDAQKLTSSLTLFGKAASFLLSHKNTSHDFVGLVNYCNKILRKISEQGYLPCEKTLALIEPDLSKIE